MLAGWNFFYGKSILSTMVLVMTYILLQWHTNISPGSCRIWWHPRRRKSSRAWQRYGRGPWSCSHWTRVGLEEREPGQLHAMAGEREREKERIIYLKFLNELNTVAILIIYLSCHSSRTVHRTHSPQWRTQRMERLSTCGIAVIITTLSSTYIIAS